MKPKKIILISIFAFFALCALFALWIEPQRLVHKTIDVQSPHWKNTQLRIAFISDIHFDGLHNTPKRIEKIASILKREKPDLILLGGDYFGGYFGQSHPPKSKFELRSDKENRLQENSILSISKLNGIAPLGVYAIMGNHDCWWSCSETRRIFKQMQIPLLENQTIRVKSGGFDFWICGLEDFQTQKPNYRVCETIPEDASTLVLAHNPASFKPYLSHAKIQFSGHLHGGQVRFPYIGAPITSGPFTEETIDGFMTDKDRILIVTSGIGMVGLPIRFNAPPEIMFVNLVNSNHLMAQRK